MMAWPRVLLRSVCRTAQTHTDSHSSGDRATEASSRLQPEAQRHHSAGDHNTWRDAAIIGTHLVDAVAIAVQRCSGMALHKSQWRERQVAMGAQAA